MPTGNFKSLTLLCGVLALAVLCLCISLAQAVVPSFLDLVWFGGLLILTLAAGRFTVSLVNADGAGQSHKTLAEAFILLAALMYGAPAAMLLAAADSACASRHERNRRVRLFSISAAVVSIYLAVAVARLWMEFLTGQPAVSREQATHLGLLLIPLLALGIVQYALNTLASTVYIAFETGKARFVLSQGSLVWSAMAQLTSAVSAALFYSALHSGQFSYLLVGVFINILVYLLYRFNEQRLEEIKRNQREKLRHVEEIAELHMNTIESLAIAIDAKDQTTHGHVRRTQIYALELGRLLGIGKGELMALRAGALLHDVGKLAVPEYILNKPGKLTAAEFEKMKIHTIVGGDIIKRVSFPYPVEDIVRFHHEKWDGSGYPKGLKAEQIPLVARIISVVDFYDATRCDRPYRVGMKREESLALLQKMAGSSFDPRVVEVFIKHIDFFDQLIAEQDIQEQVASEDNPGLASARPDAGLASDILGSLDGDAGFRSILEAQREVYALHEIAQTIGSSLNLQDTVTLVASKLRAIVPFETCAIYLVDDLSGKARAIHVAGEHAGAFMNRRITIGEGITGWVIANARSMCNTPPELDLVGIPEEIAGQIKGVLVAPLIRENGAFGAITLYASTRASYTTEQVRLLESVSHHASTALNNALTFEKTKERALIDPLTELPNSRSFHHTLEQRIAECQRLRDEPLTVLCIDLDEFKRVNDTHGHGVGDRILHEVAAVIKKQLRQMDLLARYAGDEFVAIMPMASEEVSVMIAERVRAAVESYRFPARTGTTIKIGLSIGLATFPINGETAEQLLNAAVHAMQQDKHNRRLQPAPTTSVVASIEAYR
ncbi:MAG: diguanylate cyclase [Pyrinomonadaceae bacterium]|nr:diguanylate cyclase [Acidobacteriota bacterium]